MKIAVIGPLTMPTVQGGMSRHCIEIYSRIAANGHDVTIMCGNAEAENFRGVRLQRVGMIKKGRWDRLSYGLTASLAAARGDFDVVHYHSFASSGFCFLPHLLHPKNHRRVVATIHRLEWQDEKWGRTARALLRTNERITMNNADALIAVSKNLAVSGAQRFPKAAPIHYIANGISPIAEVGTEVLSDFGITPNRYVLIVGRIVPEKGIHLAFDAFDQLRASNRDQNYQLVVVGAARDGENEYVKSLRVRADASGSNIKMLGTQTGDTLAALFRGASIFCSPSFHEGQPLALLEAMSVGIPVAASDIVAHRELIVEAGVLTAVGDVNQLATALGELIFDPNEASRIGARGRAFITESGDFDWDRSAQETERILIP